jgi:hypothetical protein
MEARMSDQKPIILAATAAALALTANGVAAAVAITVTGQPEAIVFGAIGLAAAFIGLVTITLWACYDTGVQHERARARQPRERVFTPWNEAPHEDEMPALEPFDFAEMIEAESDNEVAAPVAGGAAIIYLADWLKSHEGRRVIAAS